MTIRTNETSRGVARSAFTLIELLVVISIILLLIAILLPTLRKARAGVRATLCQSNLRQIGVWGVTYHVDNKGILPTTGQAGQQHSYWWISQTHWFEKPDFYQHWSTWGLGGGGQDLSVYTDGALFCPQVPASIPQRRLRATHTDYALNKWLGGGFRRNHADYFKYPNDALLTSSRFWFIDGPLYWSGGSYLLVKDAWDGMPLLDQYNNTTSQDNPWVWRLGDANLGEPHPQHTASVLFGDGHTARLGIDDAVERFDENGDGSMNGKSEGREWAANKLGNYDGTDLPAP